MIELVNSGPDLSGCFGGRLVMARERWAQLQREANVPAGNGLAPFRCGVARFAGAAEPAPGACLVFWW